jgi:excisionase family DNA binding protein
MIEEESREMFLDGLLEGKYYSPKIVAELLDVDESTIRRWVNSGKIAHIRIGSSIRIKDAALRDFILRNQPLIASAEVGG